jgi:hypothetical protein
MKKAVKAGAKYFSPLLAIAFLAGVAHATPSTQIWIPSTDIQGFKVFHLGFDTYIKTLKTDTGIREGSVINNGLTVGILPFDKIQAEVGIDERVLGAEPADSNPFYFNAKVGTPEDSIFIGSPAIAAGGYDFGTASDVTNNNIGYGLIAKTLPMIGRLSLGYFTGNDKVLRDDKGHADNQGLLASWDRTISELSNKLWLAVDYQGTKSGYGALSAAFSWKFADNVSVIFGYDIYNNTLLKPTATFQIDVDFK